jgi:Na+/citrate or Na+/malate symporter
MIAYIFALIYSGVIIVCSELPSEMVLVSAVLFALGILFGNAYTKFLKQYEKERK